MPPQPRSMRMNLKPPSRIKSRSTGSPVKWILTPKPLGTARSGSGIEAVAPATHKSKRSPPITRCETMDLGAIIFDLPFVISLCRFLLHISPTNRIIAAKDAEVKRRSRICRKVLRYPWVRNREISIKPVKSRFASNERDFCAASGALHQPFCVTVKFQSNAQGSGSKNREFENFFYSFHS